ncbi:MAG: hypothetical protein COX48_00170 [bacterium (Candidatus Stahlbacteria) CG23_combo_of_CG06-09_8_20_14_all_34_7]|nr:MAG: hypothetical protein COX48_00170 [bacterium (Candidatus Stahlbacteria) CG23_combo_of_CG06-09_8_20_14_all_34_7]
MKTTVIYSSMTYFTKKYIVKIFYMRCGFDFTKLNFINKILTNMLNVMMLRKKEKTEDEKEMLAAYEHPVDYRDRKSIKELIEFVKS